MPELSLQDLAGHLANGGEVLDIRSFQKFTSGFISGSIFLNPDKDFQYYFSIFFPTRNPVVVIVDDDNRNVSELLKSLGIGEIKGYISFDQDHFTKAGLPLDLIIDVEPDEFEMDLKFDPNAQPIDLRSLSDFQKGHIRGAQSFPLQDFNDIVQIANLDDEGTLYFYADDDNKSATAASLMKRQGLHNLRIVSGGWRRLKNESTLQIEQPNHSKN